jgi:hypothetical protein
MPGSKITFDTVQEIGLALPEVVASTVSGALALRLRGKLLACKAINKSAEPDSLGVRIDFEQRDALLAEAPQTYYVTNHYVNYPMVLVRRGVLSHRRKSGRRNPRNARDRCERGGGEATSRPRSPWLQTG